jgi:hypothetical protein
MILIKKYAISAIFVLLNSIVFCADHRNKENTVQVTSTSYPFHNGQQTIELEKDILMKMPYMRALLQPQDYGNPMAYSENKLYLDFETPQEKNIFHLLYILLQKTQPKNSIHDIFQYIHRHYPIVTPIVKTKSNSKFRNFA